MKKIIMLLGVLMLTACTDFQNMVSYTDEREGNGERQREYYQPLDSEQARPVNVGSPIQRLSIESKGSRIKINGTAYTDQSGAIDDISPYSESGYITHLRSSVAYGVPAYDVLLDRPFKPYTKKVIASYIETGGRYQFTIPKHGDRIATRYELTSQGIILFHEGGFFSYIADNYASDILEIPEGFHPSPVQATDISKANYLAFVRDAGPIKVGFMTLNDLRQYEIIFLDIKTGEVRASEVVRVDAGNSEDFNLSFNQVVKLVMTNSGLIVCNLSHDYKDLFCSNLHTGRRKVLVSRDNGIANFKIGSDAKGGIWLRSTYGATDERYIPDVVLELNK